VRSHNLRAYVEAGAARVAPKIPTARDRRGNPFLRCTLRRCEVSRSRKRREATSQFPGDQTADERANPTSSDGSTSPIIDLRTVPPGAPQLVIGRGTVLSVPSPYTVSSAAGVLVQGTLQVSESTSPVESESRGTRLHARIRNWRAHVYPEGTSKSWGQQARECAKHLGLPSLTERTMRRAFGGK
jgi:hypothetical protein